MRLAYESAAVRVPATTANMGPGFDSFGMAFRYYDEVEARATVGATHVRVEGVGEGAVATDDSNLVVRALRAGLESVGAPQAGFEMRCLNRIPHGGGMGSSASAVVAGLILARGLLSEPQALDDGEVFRLATDFEGHPDNVAPAVFGGATVAWTEADGEPRAAPIPVDGSLPVSLLIPPPVTRLSTAQARRVLPESVPRADALFNTSRAAILILALTGRPDLLMVGTEDRLHQDYRRNVLPASMAVMDSLRAQGYPAVISGAGPTVFVLADVAQQTRFTLERHGWTVLRPGIDLNGAQSVRAIG